MANPHSVSSNIETLPNKWSITQDITQDCTLTSDEFDVKHAEILQNVRFKLRKTWEHPTEGLIFVDSVQRIAVDCHFHEEIEEFLKTQYMEMSDVTRKRKINQQDLYEVSLRFRLLRQQGYYVPEDVFDNFKGKDGKFTKALGEDIRGLMSLYEASHLSIEGEDMLDEAQKFSRNILDHHDALIIKNTLRHPFHKSSPSLASKNFNLNNGCDNALQELAKMDFEMLQSIHRAELLQVSRWWKELGLSKELKFARDQPLKWHMWSVAALTDPILSNQRIELTKPISLIYIIDDIYDVYGTVDELILFTEAVKKWELAGTEQLPDYMKTCFKALYDITNEIGYKVYKEHGWNPVESLQKTWANLCDAFLVEAKWFATGHVPKADEYLKNGVISSGAHVVLVHMFFLLGDGRTQKTANLVDDNPVIISCVATILRLWDDLGSAKDENQDGKDGSYVTCYIKEHQGTSVEIARQHVINMISMTWKRLNKECLSPNPFSTTFTKASLNLARMVSMMYSYDDNQGLPDLEEHIKSMF